MQLKRFFWDDEEKKKALFSACSNVFNQVLEIPICDVNNVVKTFLEKPGESVLAVMRQLLAEYEHNIRMLELEKSDKSEVDALNKEISALEAQKEQLIEAIRREEEKSKSMSL